MNKLNICIYGSYSHYPDWLLLKGAINRFAKNQKIVENCVFYICGYTKNNAKWDEIVNLFRRKKNLKVEVREGLDTNNYMNLLKDMDVCLMPLEYTEFNLCKCIVGDSLISTNNGIFWIEDIVNNNIKCNVEVKGDKNPVINYFKYENIPTIKIITKDGYEIEGSNHHKLLINNEWVELQNLKIGDSLELTPPNFEQAIYQEITYPMLLTKKNRDKVENSQEEMLPRIRINERWGRLLGYMMGDGCFSGNKICISCDKREEDIVKDVTDLFTSIGIKPTIKLKQIDKRCKTSRIKEGNGVDVCCATHIFNEIAIKYGWKNKNGKVFRVPKVILQSPKSVIKEFLRGLFEADGTNTECGLSFTTKNEKFAKEVQIILLGFGIVSKIFKTYNKKYNKNYNKNYYRIDLGRDASDIYSLEIGFISKRKSEKLNHTTSKKHGNAMKKMQFKDEIASVEQRVATVYDIEVKNTHCYNANGIINHNSALKLMECTISKTLPVGSALYSTKELKGIVVAESPLQYEQTIEKLLDKEYYNQVLNYVTDLNLKDADVDKRIENTKATLVAVAKEDLSPKLDNVLIKTITYDDSQVSEYETYNNSHIRTKEQKSYLFEYNPIIDIVSNLPENIEYLGIFSWKFPQKTGFSKNILYKSLNHYKYKEYDFLNLAKSYWKDTKIYLEFSYKSHPKLQELIKKLLIHLGKDIYPDRDTYTYSNFFIMKTEHWKDYIENWVKPALEFMENDPEYFEDAKYITGLPSDKLKELTGLDFYTYHTFCLERLILYFMNDKKLKVKKVI